ncbi:MAG: peptidase, partial [Nitrosopumilus sp. CG10_big_fil_rev_8_21_14_0_10_33_7]
MKKTVVTEYEIPTWIKNNAGWWADGKIDDNSFVQGIQFLIKEKIMNIPSTQNSGTSSDEIPSWIKNNAKWWADGKIDDNSFVQGIQFLVKS